MINNNVLNKFYHYVCKKIYRYRGTLLVKKNKHYIIRTLLKSITLNDKLSTCIYFNFPYKTSKIKYNYSRQIKTGKQHRQQSLISNRGWIKEVLAPRLAARRRCTRGRRRRQRRGYTYVTHKADDDIILFFISIHIVYRVFGF